MNIKSKRKKEKSLQWIYIYIYIYFFFLDICTSFFQIPSFAILPFLYKSGLSSYAVQGFLDVQGFPAMKFIKVK
jgi:hypothetical protein